MLNEQIEMYSKAYVELEIFLSKLTKRELDKIPDSFKKYINENKDKIYVFEFDNSKTILEQNYLNETKALIVKIYEKYLAPKEEKDFWNKYDIICKRIIEEEKMQKYNIDNIFKKKSTIEESQEVKSKKTINSENVQIIKYERTNIFKRIIDKIKSFFR